jgi:hypothetical protein
MRSLFTSVLVLFLYLLRAATPCAAQGPAALLFESVHLKLALPTLTDFRAQSQLAAPLAGVWHGKLEGLPVEIQLWLLPADKFECGEPEQIVHIVEDNQNQDRQAEQAPLRFAPPEVLTPGPSSCGYAALSTAVLARQGASAVEPTGRVYVLTGLAPAHGYVLEVDCDSLPSPVQDAAVRKWLRSALAYSGPARDAKWTNAEIEARWQRDAPPDLLKELETPIRTEHYVIIGNSSGGKAFAKKMEECYSAIQKVYPFPEAPGRRLLPVFLFQTGEQYWEYFSRIARISLEDAQKSKGHAWRDYYATWYESPNDTVHIHEATHQIFANRLYLSGGGSWFQEGVAEYMSTKPTERGDVARAVKKQRHTKLAEFVAIPSLLMSAGEDKKGGDEAGDHYKQAALLVEFLRDSKWKPALFQEYLHAVGRAKSSDAKAIEQALRSVYGVGIAEIEQAWVAWAQKR